MESQTPENKGEKSYLIFTMGQEEYAVEVYDIVKIVQGIKVTKMPDMPLHILGLMNLRGQVLPVVDAQAKMGLPLIEDNDDTRAIVFRMRQDNQERLLAVKVNKAKEVRRLTQDQLLPPPEGVQAKGNSAVKAVIQEEDYYIMLIDHQSYFTISEENLQQLEESSLANS